MQALNRIRNKLIRLKKGVTLYGLQLQYHLAKAIYSIRLGQQAVTKDRNLGSYTVSEKQIGSDGINPAQLMSQAKHASTRWCGIDGYEGLALDDALVYLDTYKHYSFLPLAKTFGYISANYLQRKYFSVLELGCGSGCLFEFLRLYGCNQYTGLDINNVAFKNSPFITRNPTHFILADLQETFHLNQEFDIVTSCEVLEHIREDKLDNFIGNIARHMHANSLFIGTASLQRFDVHITVHEKNWWLNKCKDFNLHLHPRHTHIEKLLAKNHPFNWDESNTSIFVLIKKT